jgi:hypothetical protein
MRDGALSEVIKQTHLPVGMPLLDTGRWERPRCFCTTEKWVKLLEAAEAQVTG